MLEEYINKYFVEVSRGLEIENFNLKEVVKSDGIPKPLRRYFQIEISMGIRELIETFKSSPNFNFTDLSIEKDLNQLQNKLKDSVNISYERFLDFLKNAIEIRFNYILRPKVTLCEICFQNSNILDTKVIINNFEYFSEYDYLESGLRNYIEDNSILEFEKDDFSKLLEKIDNEYIYELSANELIDLTKPIFELFNFDGLVEGSPVPIEAIMIFFDEKNIAPINTSLVNLINIEEKEFISKDEFIQFIKTLDSDSLEIVTSSGDGEEEIISEELLDDLETNQINSDEDNNQDLNIESDDNNKLQVDKENLNEDN